MQTNGVWDGWPVRRNKQGQYEMVGSTHRKQAATELFKGSHELNFQVVDYDDAEMLRGMIDENLAGEESKALPIREQADYVATARDFLQADPSSCKMSKKHEHGDRDCLLAFLGDSWSVVRLNTLLDIDKLAPGLGVSGELKPSNAERLVKFPKAAQIAIVEAAGEDLGKRALLRLLKETAEDRVALNGLSGDAAEKAAVRLTAKVSKLAKAVVTTKKNPTMVGVGGKPVPTPTKLSDPEVLVEFCKMVRFDGLKLAWKHRAAELHPDRGGDAKEAAALNSLWARIRKMHGKDAVPGA